MDLEIRKISLTYNLRGEYLVRRGKYKSAKFSKTGLDVQYFDRNVIDKPMKVVQAPKYAQAKQSIVLGSAFIEAALERPKPPKRGYQRWQRTEEGKLYMDWNKLKENERLVRRILIYVQDMTGEINPVYNFEII